MELTDHVKYKFLISKPAMNQLLNQNKEDYRNL